MQAEEHRRQALDGTVIEPGRCHGDRLAVDQFPAQVLHPGRRFPVLEVIDREKRAARGLAHGGTIAGRGGACQQWRLPANLTSVSYRVL